MPKARELKLGDLESPFQLKPHCGSMILRPYSYGSLLSSFQHKSMAVVMYYEQHFHPLWMEKVLGIAAGALQEPWLPLALWGPADSVLGSHHSSWPGQGRTAPAIELEAAGGPGANRTPACRSWEPRGDAAPRRWKPCLSQNHAPAGARETPTWPSSLLTMTMDQLD